ncbi:MAG: glutamyl-tRNA reductase [Planctomycetota bacterium]|nr:MAG: glutamyl-tRNA reductase [Planctomycetota bacterium]
MRTIVIGCNHRSAPVEMRERIAFDQSAIPEALRRLTEKFSNTQVVLLSTCNRTELYLARPVQGHPRIEEVIDFLADFHDLEPEYFTQGLYNYEDTEAVRHLFRVVSSLDSMVLGESQILGQAKSAFEIARSSGRVGKELEALFQQAFRVAKNIHTKTSIATGKLSVGSTAVDLARQIFSRFDDKTVMMVGAGKMGELTLTHLLSTYPKKLWITTRTDSRAVTLADKIAGRHNVPTEPVPFTQWIDRLAEADIVICSTASREPILNAQQFAPIPARRKYRSLLLIDIAVPRDIDEAVGEYENVFLYNIDDLQSVTELNIAQRREAIEDCHKIIEASVIEFVEGKPSKEIGPLINALQKHFQAIGNNELKRILPKLENASDRDRELIEQMLHRVMQKLLHNPTQLLNSQVGKGAMQVYADTLRILFNLTDQESDTKK